ncbi:unnamed protein product [Calicophoron daubneyi]|uniref:Uncharacterized protein n=1 Tax=Calicophoron daubneyi TaxID=300641 RepID=A0AAV2T3T3_CALDB
MMHPTFPMYTVKIRISFTATVMKHAYHVRSNFFPRFHYWPPQTLCTCSDYFKRLETTLHFILVCRNASQIDQNLPFCDAVFICFLSSFLYRIHDNADKYLHLLKLQCMRSASWFDGALKY